VIFLHIPVSGNVPFRLETRKVSLNSVFCIRQLKFFSAVSLFLSSAHGKQQNCCFGFAMSEFPSLSTWPNLMLGYVSKKIHPSMCFRLNVAQNPSFTLKMQFLFSTSYISFKYLQAKDLLFIYCNCGVQIFFIGVCFISMLVDVFR
jgi:hypothetical protein